jgi:Raf kinase inhibitor-like YbhB/YbcL family protein
MKIWSNTFQDGASIPSQCAFCVIDAADHVRMSDNKNPHLAWSDAPDDTKSFALICHDPDVPSKGDDVNQEGRSIPADLPRVDFFHWTLVDIPTNVQQIATASFSSGIDAGGKPGPYATPPMRQGTNDYTGWFANDAQMAGEYFGYDGPCPPWNDSIMHHYVFTLYALDVTRLSVLKGKFNAQQALVAMQGHILAQAKVTGVYSLNRALANDAA